MSGGKGGSQTTEVKVPQYVEDAAKSNLAKADELAKIGYTPYYGPDFAAFTPMQQAAFQNTSDTASAFGLATPSSQQDIYGGMPAPTQYAGGVSGYSSAPMYEQSVAELARRRPGQYEAIMAPFIDPVTGADPAAPFGNGGGKGGGQAGVYAADKAYVPNEKSTQDEGMAAARASYNGTGGTTSSQNEGSNFFGGLKDFVTDATDGGGMGASDGKHKGLGVYSGIANVLGGKY